MWTYTLKNVLALILSAAVFIASANVSVYAENADRKTAYLLMELSTGTVLSDNNKDTVVSVGTMAKLMTVLLVAEKINSGDISADDAVKTSNAANSMQGAQIWLMPGEEISVDELLKGIIIGNANDASVAVSELVSGSEEKFIELMNKRADDIGMKNTTFTDCSGYYDNEDQVSTAYDMALLCRELYKYDFLQKYFTCRMDYVRDEKAELVNANKLVRNYNGTIGFKAGYSENAGHCIAAAAKRDNAAYAAVILGYEDKDDMFTAAKRLLDNGFSGYRVISPALPEDITGEIAVRGGDEKILPLEYGKPDNIVVPAGTVGSITSSVILPEYINAPVLKNDKVGEIHYYKNDSFMFAVDIYAGASVDKLTANKLFVKLLKYVLSF